MTYLIKDFLFIVEKELLKLSRNKTVGLKMVPTFINTSLKHIKHMINKVMDRGPTSFIMELKIKVTGAGVVVHSSKVSALHTLD